MNKALAFLLALGGFIAGVSVSLTINSWAQRAEFAKAMEPKQQLAVELGVGQCRMTPAPDHVWVDRDQAHSNRYKTNGCPQFGLHGTINPAMGYSVSWVNLGWVRTNAQAVACAGDQCPPKLDPRRAECNKELTGDCLYDFRGAGGIKGMLFAWTYSPFRFGDFVPEVEAGILAYKSRWSVRVTPLNCSADDRTCSWTREIEQSTRCGSVCLSPEIGGTLWWKPGHIELGLGAQYFFRTTQHTQMTAGFAGPAQTWMLKGRIPL